MPYPGMDKRLTDKMDSCVEQVMADGEDKDSAIAICRKRIEGSVTFVGEAQFEVVEDPSELNMLLGQRFEKGELLRWKDAELARAEINANRDELDNGNIQALAETLPLMPLTDEHGHIIGLFTAASAVPDPDTPEVLRLMTEGVMYARRFQETADEIQRGTKRLSIEAMADQAICSLCGQEFDTSASYCEHLQNKHASGATRRFKGIRAIGGGAVRRPAGSHAGFNPAQVYMVAERGEGKGVGDEPQDDGGADMCACPKCGAKAKHEKGTPCSEQECPKCGASMKGENKSEAELLLYWYAAMDFGDDIPEDGDLVEAAKEKWSKDIDLDEGSLKALGWPSGEKIASAIKSGKVSYQKAIQKLGYLANVSKDSATVAKAKSIMKMLRSRFGNKSEGGSMELEQVQKQLNETLAKLEAANAELDELRQSNMDAQSRLEAAESELASVREENEQLEAARKEQERRAVLASVMSDEEFDSNKDVIMAMSDEAVKLMANKAKQEKSPKTPTTVTAGLEDDDAVSYTLA